MEWRSAGKLQLDPDTELRFPRIAAEPGLYRFCLIGRGADGNYAFYIGQADNLKRAFGRFAKHESQATNFRIGNDLLSHMRNGGVVEISVIIESPQATTEEQAADLSDKATREHLKDIAIDAEKRRGGCNLGRR